MQPVVRYPADEKVTIENDGDIELDTGTGANAKVLTTADIFVQGNTQGLLAQLTSLTNRVNQLETKLAALEAERPLSAGDAAIVDTFDTADCDLQGWSGYAKQSTAKTKVDQPRCHPCGDLGYMLGGIYDRGQVNDYYPWNGIASKHILTFVEKTYTSLPRHSALRMTFGLTIINAWDPDTYASGGASYYADEPQVLVDGRIVFTDDFKLASMRGEIPCLRKYSSSAGEPSGCTADPVKHCSSDSSSTSVHGDFNYERTVTVLHYADSVTIAVSAPTDQTGPASEWKQDHSWGLRYVSVEPIFL